MIRKAQLADVPVIGQIINDCAEYGLMLPRPLSALYENVRDFHVATQDNRVIGVCGLAVVWANLAEIYSLAITPSFRFHGWGKQLASACIEEARKLGIRKVMVLTYEQQFFLNMGFSLIDRQKLPLKVWNECLRCPKNQACDEIAMLKVLEDIPELQSPRPDSTDSEQYSVPIVRKNGRQTPKSSQNEETQ